MPERTLQQRLVAELKVLRRVGLHRLDQHLDDFPALIELAFQTVGAGTAEHIESLLRGVYTTRSEGAQGTAIGLLLGLEQGRRGANPRLLREAAASRLGYHTVDTFRKRPEEAALLTFAALIESYCREYVGPEKVDSEYKINVVLLAIKGLTMSEYVELTRRLNFWFKNPIQHHEPKSAE